MVPDTKNVLAYFTILMIEIAIVSMEVQLSKRKPTSL